MLDGLCAVVRGDVESELINAAHTNVLLLRQVFSQAEKWHLKLQADISELENRYVSFFLYNWKASLSSTIVIEQVFGVRPRVTRGQLSFFL